MAYKQLRKEEKQKAKQKKRYIHLIAELQRIARKDKKALLNDQCKKKTIEQKRIEISSQKLEVTREYFMQRWGQ